MKVENNKFDRFADVICIISLTVATVVLMMAWTSLDVPTSNAQHAAGLIAKFGVRASYVMLLFIGWLVFVVLSVIERLPGMWSIGNISMSIKNKDRIYRTFKTLLGSVKLLVTVLFSLLTVITIYGVKPDSMFYNIVALVLLGDVTALSIRMMVVNKEK